MLALVHRMEGREGSEEGMVPDQNGHILVFCCQFVSHEYWSPISVCLSPAWLMVFVVGALEGGLESRADVSNRVLSQVGILIFLTEVMVVAWSFYIVIWGCFIFFCWRHTWMHCAMSFCGSEPLTSPLCSELFHSPVTVQSHSPGLHIVAPSSDPAQLSPRAPRCQIPWGGGTIHGFSQSGHCG